MKREASARSWDACAMMSSSDNSSRVSLRAGPEAVHCFAGSWLLHKLIMLALGTFVGASLVLPTDHARSEGARPIRVIISVPPGGSIDHMVRVLTDHLSTN